MTYKARDGMVDHPNYVKHVFVVFSGNSWTNINKEDVDWEPDYTERYVSEEYLREGTTYLVPGELL